MALSKVLAIGRLLIAANYYTYVSSLTFILELVRGGLVDSVFFFSLPHPPAPPGLATMGGALLLLLAPYAVVDLAFF